MSIDRKTIESLEKVIDDFRNGHYPHPRSYRPNNCPHGRASWQECESCDEEYWQTALNTVYVEEEVPTLQAKIESLEAINTKMIAALRMFPGVSAKSLISTPADPSPYRMLAFLRLRTEALEESDRICKDNLS